MLRATIVFAVLVLPATAWAQSVQLIGEFRDWSAYSAAEGAGRVCFAMSRPTEISPQPDGLTDAYLYLTNRPAESVRFEFNLVAGFTFAPDTPATVAISGQSFDLFTAADAAWLLDPGQGDQLASAIRAGSTLTIEGTSDKGIRVREVFSLSGATAASRAIESC